MQAYSGMPSSFASTRGVRLLRIRLMTLTGGEVQMVRLKCGIAYDGSDFSGYQIQPNSRTVQGALESALARIHKGRMIRVTASGRTDAGVHARGQVIHFDTDLDISPDGWRRAMNGALPEDVSVRWVSYTDPSFHARYDAVKKEYRFRVLNLEAPDVFRRRYTYWYPYRLDVTRMREGARALLGTHDFSSFCASGTDVQNKERTVETLEILADGDEWVFRIVGDGFLYQMIRIIIGTLLEVGNERRHPQDIERILKVKDRRKAGPTVPGNGLILWKVTY